jgi:hypothetical protein
MHVFGDDHAPHGHMHIKFNNVRVPKSNMLLGEGRGFEISQLRLGPGRIHHCMRSIGQAEKALDLMVKRGLSRKAFGKELVWLGGNVEIISRARIEIEAMRLMVLKAAKAMDVLGNREARIWVHMVKAMVPERVCKIIDQAIQMHGALGVSQHTPLAHMYTHQRTLRLADGPDEVHHLVVGRGPLRQPRQMLAAQTYDGHKSIHDDAMAADLGCAPDRSKGPRTSASSTRCCSTCGANAWFETGCLSAHYQTMVVEGESVRAFVQLPAEGERHTRIWAEKADGTPVLTGTASVGRGRTRASEIAQRVARLRPPAQLVINRDLRVGQRGAVNPERVRMGFDQHMGPHYPFTLADKLKVITEPCPWYTPEGGAHRPGAARSSRSR